MNTLSHCVSPNSSSCSNGSNLQKEKQHIVKFHKWLKGKQQKSIINSTRREKNELLFLLLQLKKQLSHSISLLNMPCVTERQEFSCEFCSGKIILEPFQDIWECLENHCHLETCEGVERKADLTKDDLLNNIPYHETSCKETIYKFTENSDGNTSKQSLFDSSVGIKEGDSRRLTDTSSDLNVSSVSYNNDKNQTADLPFVKSRSWYSKDYLKNVDSKTDYQVVTQLSSSTIDHGKNTFRFNFEAKYPPNLEALLYPKLYRNFDIDGDPILQKTGPERTVCLICSCELLNQKTASSIISHIASDKHLQAVDKPKTQLIIKNYHDTFLKLEGQYQSHQIYFATDEESYLLKCVVCVKYVRCCDVEAHISDNTHISRLIDMSIHIDKKLLSFFYFLESHVEVYGVFRSIFKILDASDQKEKPKGTHDKQHVIVKSIDNCHPTSKMKLPKRFNQHMKYLQFKDDLVLCTICEDQHNIFTLEDTHMHLVQPSHLVKSKVQLANYLYYCVACDKKCHDEITWIVHFREEKKRHLEAVESSMKDKPLEYECLTCKLVFFGDSESLKKHRQSHPYKRNDKKKAIALNKATKQYFATKATIRENGDKLLKDAESVISNTAIVHQCCDDLESALKIKYSLCKAYPFGSRISGLGCSQSDLDIFIDIGSMYNGDYNQDEQNQLKIITNIMCLIKKKKVFQHIICIPTARTPIIQLKHKPTDLECDVSFVHGLSVENTKFIRYCFEMQPISQKLILLVKKWSHLCGLNENITTYALAMLGIFYLQKNKYLLSVQTLKDLNKKNVTIIGWETIDYVTPKEEIIKHIEVFDGDIIDLLIGFFKFYSDFNYKLNIVCPLLGTEISKDLFSIDPKGSALPKEMASYSIKVNTEKSPEYFRCLSSFCIQDPFDLSHNLTKACSNAFLDKFVKLCTLTHTVLSNLKD